MNREELEKDFDEKFFVNNWNIPVNEYVEIKNHIFNELIPEVLKSVIPELQNTQTNDDEINMMRYWSNDCIHYIKQKAKEFWFII